MLTSTLDFDIGSDLYQAGYTEDGRPFIAERYFIQAVDKDGNRWTHVHTFAGAQVECDEEGYDHICDVRVEAMERVKQLITRVKASREICMLHWVTADPVYGSRAYESYGADEQIAREHMEG